MKAITVWQPWASLIAIGAKPYEFRRWRAPASIVGQRIAIHAGARKPRHSEVAKMLVDMPRNCLKAEIAGPFLEPMWQVSKTMLSLPLRHIVCTAILGKPVLASEIVAEFGIVNDSDRNDHFNWAWPMLDIIELKPPVAACGAQSLWDWHQ